MFKSVSCALAASVGLACASIDISSLAAKMAPETVTFMVGCEILGSLQPPTSIFNPSPTPVALCSAIRERAKEEGAQEMISKCETGTGLAYKLTRGMPPHVEVPSQIGERISLACKSIVSGSY